MAGSSPGSSGVERSCDGSIEGPMDRAQVSMGRSMSVPGWSLEAELVQRLARVCCERGVLLIDDGHVAGLVRAEHRLHRSGLVIRLGGLLDVFGCSPLLVELLMPSSPENWENQVDPERFVDEPGRPGEPRSILANRLCDRFRTLSCKR